MTGYALVSDHPSDDEVLLAGDRVVMKWDLFQTGTWFVSYQVARIEAMFERDGRVELLSYSYDEDAMTLAFTLEIKSNNIGQTSMPALPGMASSFIGIALVLTVGRLAVMIIAATTAFVYVGSRTVELWRKWQAEDALADPDLPPEEREVLERRLEVSEASIAGAVEKSATAVIVLVVAVVIFKVMGVFK